MQKIIISGCNGHMGRVVGALCASDPEVQVVAGFEKQLDKLFQDDALDIKSDVEVLENMLKKDGLADDGMNLSGFRSEDTLEDLKKTADDWNKTGGQGLTLGG